MLDSCLADEFGSGEGLEDSLFIQPAMLYQVDEFDTMFNSIRLMKDARGESIIDRLLRFYGSSNGLYTMRKLALRREDRNDPNRVRQQGNGLHGPAFKIHQHQGPSGPLQQPQKAVRHFSGAHFSPMNFAALL